jgi:hypothetical protein
VLKGIIKLFASEEMRLSQQRESGPDKSRKIVASMRRISL